MKHGVLALCAAAIWPACLAAGTDVIVNTGEPGIDPDSGHYLVEPAPGRGARIYVDAPVEIVSVQHFIIVQRPFAATYRLHADRDGLPGTEIHGVTAGHSPTGGADWHGPVDLRWEVPAGTYWVTFEAQDSSAGFLRPIGHDASTFPLRPLAEEASAGTAGGGAWHLAVERAGWRVSGTPTLARTLLEAMLAGEPETGMGPAFKDQLALAQAYLSVPDFTAACAVMESLLDQVDATRDKDDASDAADHLGANAQAVILAMDCD